MDTMIGKMAKMFPMMIALGFMIALAAFFVGYNNAQTAAAYFAQPKVIRETTLMAQRVSMESIGLWMPTFKFLGIGLILAGIVMALRTIIDKRKGTSEEVLLNLPANAQTQLPAGPWYGRLMPLVMMLPEMFFLIAFGIGLWLSGIARIVFAHPLPEIDAAGAGSALLNGTQTIHIVEGWLVPFKFFAISTEFLAITMGLATIIFILSVQTKMLSGVLGSDK